jgi:Lipase C-terminal domain/AF_1763-like, C-terminal domain/Lipase (class 2)
MKKLSHCSFVTLLVLMVIGLGFLSTPASADHQKQFLNISPMIFVHGYTGSAQQFEWQAMRFASNGYPQEYLNAFEYDSPNYFTTAPQVLAALDQRIDAILSETGAGKVELLGHSLGTFVSTAYLNSSPARAAKVAHYVALDGGSGASLPGGVPTLAIFGGFGLNPNGSITGAQNVVVPKAPHNETCTSPVSFAYMYKFFTGLDPESTAVLPDRDGHFDLAGRAVLFPQNAGVAGATVEIYELNGETGARKHRHPEAIYPIDTTGNFGPFKARAGAYYEINIARPGGNHHFYIEPRIRSDYFIRLNTSPLGQGLGDLMTKNPDQTNLIITKNREWLGDQSDGFNDILAINGINIVNAVNAPRPHMLVAYFICDWNSDHITNLTSLIPVPALNTTFLSAVDLYLRGATPPDATISIVETPRGDCGTMHEINVPNWAIINQAGSFSESISVQLDDYIEGRCDEKWDAHQEHGHDDR